MRAEIVIAAAMAALAASTTVAIADDEVEVRAATSAYRFIDWSRDFEGGFVLSALYAGDPEFNELHLGAGWTFGGDGRDSLTPIVYLVSGSDSERGVTLGFQGDAGAGVWHVVGFGGRFFETGGETGDYWFVDTLDVTVVSTDWEAGLSADVYRFEDDTWWAVGPTLKHHDAMGLWAASVRTGDHNEFRVARILEF